MSAERPVTLCIVNFQGAKHLPRALAAVKTCGSRFDEILVVDDASTDDCMAWLRSTHPHVRVVQREGNCGPGAARNTGFAAASHDLVLFQDNDIELTPGSVSALKGALSRSPGALVVAPRVLYAATPEVVQYDSADCHFLGLMITRNTQSSLHDAPRDTVATTSLVTACFLIDRARWSGDAPFDEWFGFNYEDHDFGVRASVRGFDLLVAPSAQVLHGTGTANLSYRPGGAVPMRRVYYLLRNRWSVLTKAYATRSLILLAPILLCFELFQFAGAASKGWLGEWRSAVASWWRELPRLRRERRILQQQRRRGDRLILKGGPLPFTDAVRSGFAQRLVIATLQGVSRAYWRLVRSFL